MIKMDYGDINHQENLEKDFPLLLDNVPARQKEWTRLRKKLCEKEKTMEDVLPTIMIKMMILPFDRLVEIYDKYVSLNLPRKDKALHNDFAALFNYDKKGEVPFKSLSQDIINFFKDEGRFEIHTCHYCDMAYINCYTMGKENRTQFDLDHVLPKGKCPLVALSLYNLVPSCPTCNSRIKGRSHIPGLLEQRRKLSPTSADYDFDKNVELWVSPITSKIHNTDFLKHQQEYEIKFDITRDSAYENEIKFFHLQERYNRHKSLALRLMDLKVKYTPAKIREMARIICNIGEDKNEENSLASNIVINHIQSDIFGSKFVDTYHRAFGKLYKDILNDD